MVTHVAVELGRPAWLHVEASLRECWVRRDCLRASATRPDWTPLPTWHALAVEAVSVPPEYRHQGECRAFLKYLTGLAQYDLIVVEGVGNPLLAAALRRWGWQEDAGVHDFYWRVKHAA